MKILTTLIIPFLISFSLLAGDITGLKAKEIHPSAKSIIKNDNGEIRYITFEKNSLLVPESPFELIKRLANLPENCSIELNKVEKDQLGFVQSKYDLFYNSFKVENKLYKINSHNGYIASIIFESPNFSVNKFQSSLVSISTSDCNTPIIQNLKLNESAKFKVENNLKPLWIQKNNTLILCYKIAVEQEKPLLKKYVYVNTSSNIVEKVAERIIHTDEVGSAITKYSGTKSITTNRVSSNSYTLSETGRGGGITTLNYQNSTSSGIDFTNTSNTWANSTDNVAYDAHYGAEATYDFYLSKFGRSSFDNAGSQIINNVHYDVNYANAFWDGLSLTFGDGNGTTLNALTSLNIVGHEFTHGVTQYSANLEYLNESGALNESFSDIFGTTIEFLNNPTTANWVIGDEISVNGNGFRSMSNPKNYNDPNTYQGTNWVTDPNIDYGGVHSNSGVQNYWYYLLCQGGSGTNDNGDSYAITGIGRDDAIKIAYRTLTYYLTSSSTYSDARDFSIQAAKDLFGDCSQQLIQTTNAWYAVGVGGAFTNAVIANFTAANTTSCGIPFTASFTSLSTNAGTYSWNFGDGSAVSTLMNPSHTYTAAGSYTVTLTIQGQSGCNGSDVETKTNFITISTLGAPISATCNPATAATNPYCGITSVRLKSINNSSNISSEGNKDFTCTGRTEIPVGEVDSIFVETSQGNYENVKIWIDFNNDGDFLDVNESVFSSLNSLQYHKGLITFPTTNVVKNTALRMRVIDEYNGYTISSACYTSIYGQTEDYTVIFKDVTAAPIADFSSDIRNVSTSGNVNYSQYCQNVPTTFSWIFSGGTPSTSTSPNPAVYYSNTGSYTTKLIVSNAFGSDTIEKLNYINVTNNFNMCLATTSTDNTGNLYDSGGPNGVYNNYENCNFLIAPPCATSIRLVFSSFGSESGYDQIRIYNGANSSAPLLYTGSGSSIPPAQTATSGKMYITWSTDGSSTSTGFASSWTSTIVVSPTPDANFTVSDTTPALNTTITFSDVSTQSPIGWKWDFGDGTNSTLKNPTKSYTTSGTKTVKLIAYSCSNSDTIVKTINVEAAPTLQLSSSSLSQNLSCNDSIISRKKHCWRNIELYNQ